MKVLEIILTRRHRRLLAAGLLLLAASAGITSVLHAPTHHTANWEGTTNWETLH